jgi:hypothetical protein
MTDADLIALAEREQARLTTDGDTCAAAIIRAMVDRIRPPSAVVKGPTPLGWGPQIAPVSSDGPRWEGPRPSYTGTGFPAA